MTGIYLTWLADTLRGRGLAVVEYEGWQTRAKASGGYADGSRPWGVMWHHTASNATPGNDASYMCYGSPDAPIANVLIARDGTVWLLAAGPTNTNGKGGPYSFSGGNVPADSMNSYAFGVEIANEGTGEAYPEAQINAAFLVSNVVNQVMGNAPSDVCTHQQWAPSRKVDPATAAAVQGGWAPASCTSAGTWSLLDLRAECEWRADPPPQPERDDEMACTLYELIDADAVFVGLTAGGVGTDCSWCTSDRADRYKAIASVERRPTTVAELQSMILLGPLPTEDSRHEWTGREFTAVIA